jgi:hypothetical protein
MDSLNTHNTPQVLYDALATQFGETVARKEGGESNRWVTIGCGSVLLTFFAPRDPAGKVSVTVPELMTYEKR